MRARRKNPAESWRAAAAKGRPIRITIWALACGLSAAGCCPKGPNAHSQPAGVLADYARHLRAQDHAAALALVSAKRRESLGAEQFEAFVHSAGSPLEQALAALGEPERLGLQWRARLPDGRQIILVLEQGAWRIAQGPILPPNLATPQEALDGFLAAIDQQDCQALVRCAPPEVRTRHPLVSLEGGCGQQIEALKETAARLRQARAGLVQVGPDRAELAYLPHRKLVLVRRGQHWYIDDL